MHVMLTGRAQALRGCGVAAALLAALLAGCSGPPAPDAVPAAKVEGEAVLFPEGSPQLAALLTKAAVERPAAAVQLNGRLGWNEDRTVRIFTPLAGRVARSMVQPGDAVAQGQVLAVIASPDFGQAQAEARRALGDLTLARQNLARARDLHEHGVAAARDLHAAEAEFARTEAESRRAEARLKLYGGGDVDQSYALKSPIAGVVVEKNINPGQELRPDQLVANAPALFVITNPSSLWVWLDATEKDLAGLAVGGVLTIRVPVYPDEAFPAKVAAIADFLDPVTRTVRVRAVIDNAARRLKGEMFVTGEVKSARAAVVKVPSRAVIFQGGRYYLFVDAGSGRYVRREVVAGSTEDGFVTIERGVSAGEPVVAEGALLLQQILQPRRVVK